MTSHGTSYTLTYDAENRLTSVSGGASASFVYDGDGNRVKATFGTETTVYVGNYYEQTGAGSTKYYYAGSQRIALRRSGYISDNGLFWLLTDHLGSTAITAYSSGGKKAELRYKAWGENRYTYGTTPTTYRFTGQRLDESTGLMYYGARYYFDILAMQGYGLWSGPYDRRMRLRVINFSRPLYVRDIMVKNGDEDKPIWISEMNWNAVPADFPAKPYGYVTEEQQARYVVEAYKRAQAEWPWVGVVNFWFFKRPSEAEKDQPWYYFRMVEPDFTPLPVYDAVKEYTR